VPLTVDLELEGSANRRYWLDDGVASLHQLFQLEYHAVSGRYLVRNLNSGEQASYPTLDDAVEQLSHISGLPVLDQALIEVTGVMSQSAMLDFGDIPVALAAHVWTDDWHRVSEWYTWPLLQ
jgi:hypothetical protein